MVGKRGRVLFWIIIIFAILIVLAFGLIVISHSQGKKSSNTNTQSSQAASDYSSVKRGVGFVTTGDLPGDLKAANQTGLVFFNAKSTDGKIPQIIQTAFESGDVSYPVPNMAADASNSEMLKQAYLDLVNKYHPYYIGIGNEIENMPDKEQFIPVYNNIYDSVKAACGNCVVYPVFQYEHFQPALADKMKMDLLVFTSYPFTNYSNLNNIPSDYYSKAKKEADKKGVGIGFTEIGWPSTSSFQSGESDAQLAFYNKFKSLVSGMDVRFISWGLLHGVPSAGAQWADMGLIDPQGNKKPLFYEIVNDSK